MALWGQGCWSAAAVAAESEAQRQGCQGQGFWQGPVLCPCQESCLLALCPCCAHLAETQVQVTERPCLMGRCCQPLLLVGSLQSLEQQGCEGWDQEAAGVPYHQAEGQL